MHGSNRRSWFLLPTGASSQLTVVVIAVVCGCALVLTVGLICMWRSCSGLSVWVYDQQVFLRKYDIYLTMRLAKMAFFAWENSVLNKQEDCSCIKMENISIWVLLRMI